MPKENTEAEPSEVTIVPTKENASVEIIPFGTTDRIRLSAAIVRQMIAQPTRNGKLPDDNQCIKFIMLCKARHLNPFEGDAFMLGYDTQSGPQFSLITAHQVFLKRAEASKGFNGMESGVIVEGPQGGLIEREGDLTYDKEKLIGGWAKVYRKDREIPFYRRLKLSTFNTGRSRWEKDPAGMICKCAEADALRTAFPTHLGGLYIQEEAQPIDVDTPAIPIQRAKVPKLNDKNLSGSTEGRAENDNTPEAHPVQSGADSHGQPQGSETRGSENQSSPAQTSSAESKPKRTKKKLEGLTPEPLPQMGPNETEMLRRLDTLKLTEDDLVAVAISLDAIEPDQGWNDIEEDRFGVMLREANWAIVEAALKDLDK